ncbi:MAG: RnfABCDGE type electron transport complex subunit G [Bacteroidales bacterium]|nr:RnfABCDGE type electron transport complex subunit G [Bacteroidales bacterium]
MKKLESTLGNMVIVLTLVSLVAAGLLAVMNEVTSEPIRLQAEQKEANGIKKVLVIGADEQVTVAPAETKKVGEQEFIIYKVSGADGKELGAAVKTSVQGFSPNLTVMVGFDSKGTIKGYEILSQAETPGLGANVPTWFQEGGKGNVIGMNPGKDKVSVKKDGGDVEAITASTITSRAFLKAINLEYNALFGNGNAHGTTGATSTHGSTGATQTR